MGLMDGHPHPGIGLLLVSSDPVHAHGLIVSDAVLLRQRRPHPCLHLPRSGRHPLLGPGVRGRYRGQFLVLRCSQASHRLLGMPRHRELRFLALSGRLGRSLLLCPLDGRELRLRSLYDLLLGLLLSVGLGQTSLLSQAALFACTPALVGGPLQRLQDFDSLLLACRCLLLRSQTLGPLCRRHVANGFGSASPQGVTRLRRGSRV
mmetsp:Transcript_89672/g.280619  ORF Transcript_89672/g.280619 Transcript_89672/m.280619 type:complete len:205 (+) Transcript_89672:876-1490(+)